MPEFVHEYEHRVRYRESDPMGLVYHAHYVDYFEAARTEAIRAAGISYKDIEDGGVFMPVLDLSVDFKRPAYYDDLLTIRTAVTLSETGTRVRFDYEVARKGEDVVLATGHVTLCFLDRKRNRPVRAPEHVVTAMSRLRNDSRRGG
jgi:acyl-CoA thioester hydrolase